MPNTLVIPANIGALALQRRSRRQKLVLWGIKTRFPLSKLLNPNVAPIECFLGNLPAPANEMLNDHYA
jgi:hypothetical protein